MKYEPVASSLDQLVSGMNLFNLVLKIKEKPDIFKYVFCHSKAFNWDYETFLEKIKVNWSDAGTNKKTKELKVYKSFIDMLEQSYHDGIHFICCTCFL